jgi:hypothetical protein
MPSAGIIMSKEIQTATFLGGATFLSGFVWQPGVRLPRASPVSLTLRAPANQPRPSLFNNILVPRGVIHFV